MRKPDFEHNLLRALRGERPERATMFELFLYDELYERLAGHGWDGKTRLSYKKMVVDAMAAGGYDYAPFLLPDFYYPKQARERASTHSLNGQGIITDWESFEKYVWPDISRCDLSILDALADYMPEGMKLCLRGPGGVLENTIAIVGYDNLCYLLYDDPELVQAITDKIGSTMVSLYEALAGHEAIGFLCSNDDWGFNTQTFLSPEAMRRYIFPWHKKIVAAAHAAGKPCMLHSCGEFRAVIDDIVEDMGFDARHSYEDNICPVEDAYELLNGRITVMGGIDMNLMTSGTPDAIYARARAMLERTAERGGYTLGTGNSIAPYIPIENYMALRQAALDTDNA
ncbi:MAG: hypothetical protein IJ412_02170 [Oscillospiraceae bacterium]|nr:hypothetical protein [Oscillospiraceae bacterium]